MMQFYELPHGYKLHLTKNTVTIVNENGHPLKSPYDCQMFAKRMAEPALEVERVPTKKPRTTNRKHRM